MKKLLPSIIFNVGEFALLALIGMLVGVQLHEVLCILIVFMLIRNVVGKGKHYKSPVACIIWSSTVFTLLFLSVRIDFILALVLTCFYATAQTGKVDVRDTFMWQKQSNYDYIQEYVDKHKGTVSLDAFEERLKYIDEDMYKVYYYKFKEKATFAQMNELLDMDNRRIADRLKSIELAINLYFDI